MTTGQIKILKIAWKALMSKVCVLSQRVPYPPNKGEKLRTYHQIEFLNRLGYEVEVFSLIETAEDKKNAEEAEILSEKNSNDSEEDEDTFEV